MLSSISWSLFLTVIFLALFFYYAFVGIVYYPKELLGFLFRQKRKPAVAAPQPDVNELPSVIGAVREAPDTTEHHQRYQPSVPTTAATDSLPDNSEPDISLLGPVADLVAAAQTLVRVIADGEGDRQDIISLLPSLLAQYPGIAASKYRFAINAQIQDHCRELLSLDMELTEINALWPNHS